MEDRAAAAVPAAAEKEAGKHKAGCALRGNPEGREGAALTPLLAAGTAGARAGWLRGPFQGGRAGVGLRRLAGPRGLSYWLPLRPQVNPSPSGTGTGASGEEGGPAGEDLGAPRGGPESFGRPLISPRGRGVLNTKNWPKLRDSRDLKL